MGRPEVLAPAGDFEKLRFAVAYGADAVYLAGKAYGMRTASGNFTPEEMAEAVAYCHARGVKVYVTVNTLPRDEEMALLPAYLSQLDEMGVDALILADLGVLMMAKKHAPHCEIHMSTQTSIVNAQAATAWHELGASRVVLARELTLEQIAYIRANTPKTLELEAFVHGAMCMAYSGRCLLSQYLAGRDPNRGNCAQPCRWSYRVVEEYRPNEYMPIVEDEHGTYIFNSKDMNMLPYVDKVAQAGIDSLKIEGRVKTAYYAAVVTNAYRRATELYAADPAHFAPPQELLDEVWKVSHREYFTGFYFGDPNTQHMADSTYIREWDVCAVVEACDENGMVVLRHKNKFAAEDELELLVPGKPAAVVHLTDMRNGEGEPIALANVPHMTVLAKLPFQVPKMSVLRRKK